jgi:hypothetical protein
MVSVKVNSFEGYNCPVFLSFERAPTVGRQDEVAGSIDGQVWIFLQLQACSFFFTCSDFVFETTLSCKCS